MLPDIDTNDGDEGEERVLVSGGGDLETLGGGVQALQRRNVACSHKQLLSTFVKRGEILTSQPQPEPWIPAVVVLNSFLRLSRDPKASVMACLRGPSGRAPPLPLPSDLEPARFFQKREWLMCPLEERESNVSDDQIDVR